MRTSSVLESAGVGTAYEEKYKSVEARPTLRSPVPHAPALRIDPQLALLRTVESNCRGDFGARRVLRIYRLSRAQLEWSGVRRR